jgi:TrmH family RNA methyltransferase
LNKSELQLLSKLSQKKYRDAHQKFIVEGKRLVEEGLKSNFKYTNLIATNDFIDREEEYIQLLHLDIDEIDIVSNKDFNKITSTKNPQGIAAVFLIPSKLAKINDDKLIVCLENISDPGNVGTILRSCDWFGIKSVLLSRDCADIYNPKVLRASMGAVFNLSIFNQVDLYDELNKLKERSYKLYYADMNGIDYKNAKGNEKKVITFCNEAFGPSDELKIVSHTSITIPKKGNIDSLNVSAAVAVILSELA